MNKLALDASLDEEITADFDGGRTTFEDYAPIMRELEERYGITDYTDE